MAIEQVGMEVTSSLRVVGIIVEDQDSGIQLVLGEPEVHTPCFCVSSGLEGE